VSDQSAYAVEIISQSDADTWLRQLRTTPGNPGAQRTLVLPGGLELSGEFSLTARDAKSGEIEWEHSGKNLITDYGRRRWMEQKWGTGVIAFAPSIEAPQLGRYSVATDSTQSFASGPLTPGLTPATHTKTFSTTFGLPGINRTLGIIALGDSSPTIQVTNRGLEYLMAFALLTPPKTQTTTQTLEVNYRVSMNPIA